MTLSATARALLSACSEAMVRGTEAEINLYNELRFSFSAVKDEILDELVRGVEDASGNRRTLRRCDPALFDSHGGNGLHVVVCEVSTPEGVVTELSDDMALYAVGAYENGPTIEERASQEKIESYRALVSESNRRYEQSSRGKQEAEDILAGLRERLETRIAECTDDERRGDVEYAFKNVDLGLSLEKVAEICSALDVPLKDLLFEVIQQ